MLAKKVFDDIVVYINDEGPFNVNVTTLQKKSGYSKRQLDRLFVRFSGSTVSAYLKIQRLFIVSLELKFSTITLEQFCRKHKIKDWRNFLKKFTSYMGENPDGFRERNDLFLPFALEGERQLFKKHYIKCSFVTIFDFELKLQGVAHKKIRPIETMLSSHYDQKEEIIDSFCLKYLVSRDDVWTCSTFSPCDSNNYFFECFPCVKEGVTKENDFEPMTLQGDYLLFSWVGKVNDTYLRVKNIYDHVYFKFGVTRRNGFDIEKRNRVEGFRNYYVFLYYIPVIINEAILNALNDKL